MIDTRNYAHGTSLTQSYPWGTYVGGRVLCSDGKVRALKRIAPTADTFFSVPAAVTVNGRTVAGYVTVECASGSSVETDDDPAVAKFVATAYHKNHDALPPGAWRPPTYNYCPTCGGTRVLVGSACDTCGEMVPSA
jgi:hypothetical protein